VCIISIEIPRAHEVSITAKVTVSEGQPTLSVDPEASLRAELLGTIAGAQFDIDNAIAELARSGADTSALTNQRQSLQQLQKQVGSASFATLAGLRAEIAGAVAATQTLAEQGRVTATTAGQAAAEALATASANSRAQVTSIMRDMHRFDPYLHFASAEDEAAYRKREAERRAEIEAALAKATPESTLKASGLTLGQLLDAKAHGADESPEFDATFNKAADTWRNQRAAVARAGLSTKDADQALSNDVRRYLAQQGLSTAQIEARLAVSADPLDAAASIRRPEAEQSLRQTASVAAVASQRVSNIVAQPSELDDVMAALKAAGVLPPPAQPTATTHGLKIAALPSTVERGGRV